MIPHGKIPGRVMLGEPKPDDNFVDSTVRIYRMVDGVKTLVGTQDPFPEGWNDFNNRIKNQDPDGEQKEDDKVITPNGRVVEPRSDRAEIMTEVKRLMAEEKKTQTEAAKIVGVSSSTLSTWMQRERKAAAREARNAEKAAARAAEKKAKTEEILESVDAGKAVEIKPMGVMEAENINGNCKVCGEKLYGYGEQYVCKCMNNSTLASEEAPKRKPKVTTLPRMPEHLKIEIPTSSVDIQTMTDQVEKKSLHSAWDRAWDNECEELFAITAIEKTFDRNGYILELMESAMELARLRQAPSDVTLQAIDALLAVR